jgi:nucleotide-binding universal stress UspA family protein
MKPIANILVPLDFSSASRSALTYACGLADVCGASLHLLHAFQMPLIPGGSIEVCVPDQQLFEQLQDDGRQLLNEALTDEEKRRYHAVLVQRSGPAVKEILGYVRERGDIDLIVMATHGRGGMSRLMLGSVADHVVREAPCPVLTLRDPARAVSKAA